MNYMNGFQWFCVNLGVLLMVDVYKQVNYDITDDTIQVWNETYLQV